ADELPDAALRLLAVLPARRRPGLDADGGDLPRGAAVHRAAARRRRRRLGLPGDRDGDARAALTEALRSAPPAAVFGAPPREELCEHRRLDRLDEVVVEARSQRALTVALLPPAAQRDEEDALAPALAAQPPRGLEAA